MHPRAVELAKNYGIRVVVRNSMAKMSASTGTEVSGRDLTQEDLEAFRVTQVVADADKMPFHVELSRPTVLGSLMDEIEGTRLELSQPFFHGHQVWFYVPRACEMDWQGRLRRLQTDGFVKEFKALDEWVPLSVVGYGASDSGPVLHKVCEVLSQSNVPMNMGGASALSVSVAIPKTHIKEAIEALHEEFLGEEGSPS